MYCDKCEYVNNCSNYEPIGADNPIIYVLSDTVSVDDNGVPFSGKLGTFLKNTLDIYGLNENNCRFSYVVRNKCLNNDGRFTNPSDDVYNCCFNNFLDDFNAHRPKVLIAVGFTVSKLLFKNIAVFSDAKKEVYNFDGVPTILINHISYIMARNDDEKIYNEFCEDINRARFFSTSSDFVNSINFANIKRKNSSETVQCLTYSDFDNFCKKYIDDCDIVGYDLETNAAEVHSIYHRVVGFSLSANKDVGCYTILTSLDYTMPDEDKKLVEDRLRDILNTKKVMVYNCQHELPATLNWLGLEIPDIEDVFVQVKLMTGSASDKYRGTRGLKTQAVTHLNYEDWSEDLDKYMDYVTNYAKCEEDIKNLLSNYYEDEYELDNVINLLANSVDTFEYQQGADVLSYGYVPYRLIARYGSIDASVLFELWDYYETWMKKESDLLGINLKQGYEYWMQHHYAGYTLEKNGAYWNDDKAEEMYQWCLKGLINSHKDLISSPLTQQFLKKNFEDRFYIYLKDNYIIQILGYDYTPIRQFKTSIQVHAENVDAANTLMCMSLEPMKRKNKFGQMVDVGDGRNFKLSLGNIKYLAKNFLSKNPDLFDKWYQNIINDYINKPHTVEEYKEVFNPNATSEEFREFVSSILVTQQIRYVKFFRLLQQLTEDPAYDIDLYKDFYNPQHKIDNKVKRWGFNIAEFKAENKDWFYADTPDSKLLSLVNKLRLNDTLSSSKKFDMFMKYLVNNDTSFKTYQVRKIYTNSMSYKMEKLDAVAMNDIYEMYLMCHMSVEDKDTWDDRFRWLFNYKMYKKYSKTISTYIYGNVGRGNSYYVNTSDFENNVYMPKREELYEGKKDGKSLLMQQNFRINMAATGRWQCGMHNLPAGPGIKSIFTSRYKGGCIAMPDGAQMEIRILSVESGDENLIQAFKDGVDIHRFFASKIFNRPYDEVEKWQRSLAKNAVFGMIYGESEKTFADSYMHGDLAGAQKVFNDMFTGFPKIKTYIDRAHNQYEKFGKVTTLTQRYINLDDPRQDHNAILRQSQNFPIQASAEDIAGLILYKLCKWLKENNMRSKPFCFIHDSIEIDIYPTELLKIYDKMNYLFNVYPMEEFNAPVECDVPFGMSMGEECIVEDMNCDEFYNEATFTLNGYIDEMDALINNWKTVYKVVEVLDTFDNEITEEYVPWSNVFLAKKSTLSMYTGTTRYKGKRKVHLILE